MLFPGEGGIIKYMNKSLPPPALSIHLKGWGIEKHLKTKLAVVVERMCSPVVSDD